MAVKQTINKYTETKRVEVRASNPEYKDMLEIEKRLMNFREAYASGSDTTVIIKTDDLNNMIAGNKNFRKLKNKLYLTIENGIISGDFSIPLKDMDWPVLQDRYINGSAAFDVVIIDGRLSIKVSEIRMKGKIMRGFIVNKIKEIDWVEDMSEVSQLARDVRKIKQMEIQDDRIVLVTE